ncbi:MAG: autotransporter domain-containing protein [Luteimonas sp.]|nr:autotransporter domain-containing protein [Luteimonas sp.]
MNIERMAPCGPAWVARLAAHGAALLLLLGLLMPGPAGANGVMPNGKVGVAYSYDLNARYGGGYHDFELWGVYVDNVETSLPGLVLDPDGTLHGMPTGTGTYHVYYGMLDADGAGWGNEHFLTIYPPTLTLSPGALPGATIGVAYSQPFTASGGIAPYSLALGSGTSLPDGMTFAGGTLAGTPSEAGTFAFMLTVTDSASGPGGPFSASVNITLVVAKQAQAITFAAQPARIFEAGASFALAPVASASSGLPVEYSSQAAQVCSISGSTVTMLAAGDCRISADQPGDDTYAAAAAVTQVIAIGKASQAIIGFAADPAQPTYAPGGTFTVSATGGASTSPVMFASTSPSTCTVAGDVVTMQGAGNCALTANQAGDANYDPAPQATLDVVIGNAAQGISGFAANPTQPTYAPGGTFTVSASGGPSTSPVVFASSTPSVCTVAGDVVTMQGAGNCALTANQAGDANYDVAPQVALDVVIGSAAQGITGFAADPAQPVYAPGGSFTVSANGGSSTSPVVFASTSPSVCTVADDVVTMLGAGSCALTADQAGDDNYDAAPQVALVLSIDAGAQAITGFASNPKAPVYAPGGTFTVSASGGASSSPVVFASSTPSVCTVTGDVVTMQGAGSCALTASQAGDANYDAAPQVALAVAIGQAMPTLGWIEDLHKTYGEAAFELPDPASDSDGAFSFSSSDAEVAMLDGRTVTLAGAGSTTLTATQAATANYAEATVSITLVVDDRPDPTRDPSVSGGLQAQVDASMRFAAAQQANIGDRLRQVRTSGVNASRNNLALNVAAGQGGMSLPADQVAGDKPGLVHGWGVWMAGSISTGERDPLAGGDGFEFRSDGLTVGADRMLGSALLGVAAGLGWNDSDFDQSGSNLDARQRSLAAYGLWRAGEHWYVDGLLGFGRLEFDIARWSVVANARAVAQRDGDQWFGSLGAGYQHRGKSMVLAGYGRIDATRTTLDAYRESGLGVYDLAYREQRIDGSSLALGVEGSHPFRGVARTWRPFWMVEYRNALEDGSSAGINYVVQPRSTDYVLGLRSLDRNTWAFGFGLDLDLDSGWALSLQARREQSGRVESNSVGLRVSYGGAGSASASPRSVGDMPGSFDTP